MLIRTSPPAEAVSLTDAKMHLRVRHTRDDALITGCVAAATEYLDGAQGILGRAIINQGYLWKTAAFKSPLRLPISPVSAVSAITYLDVDGAVQTVDPATYYVHADDAGPYVKLVPGASWPATSARDDAVMVEFTAGMGTATTIPQPIRAAIMVIAAHLYEHREVQVNVQTFPTGFSLWDMIAPFRRVF